MNREWNCELWSNFLYSQRTCERSKHFLMIPYDSFVYVYAERHIVSTDKSCTCNGTLNINCKDDFCDSVSGWNCI